MTSLKNERGIPLLRYYDKVVKKNIDDKEKNENNHEENVIVESRASRLIS
jgi:hypothetical protein